MCRMHVHEHVHTSQASWRAVPLAGCSPSSLLAAASVSRCAGEDESGCEGVGEGAFEVRMKVDVKVWVSEGYG